MTLNARAILGLGLLLLSAATLAPSAAAQSTEELLREIEEKRDKVDVQLFKRLTGAADRESFEAMQRALRSLQGPDQLRYAYEAFESYRGVAGLEQEAVLFLAEDATSGSAPKRRGAAAGLAKFPGTGAAAQRELLLKSKDEVVRAYVVGPLLSDLAAEGTLAALELILDNAWFGTSGSREQIVAALEGFQGDEPQRAFFERLGDKGYPDLMKVAIVRVIGAREAPGVEEALVAGLKAGGPAVQYACIEALDARESDAHARPLQRLVKSDDPAVRRRAIVSLARMMGTDEGWFRKLGAMAKDKDAATRQGAVVALAELRTPAALELLHGTLLGDAEHAVRAEALQELANLRRKDSIAHLIGRVNAETGRLKMDLLAALRLITGEDQGTSYERWKRWWDAEGEAFVVPDYRDAVAAERERRRVQGAGRTTTGFYGLHVVSDRVCFVLDVSGSMKGGNIEKAKDELAKFVADYPEGDLFNVIFFSTDVYPWQDELVRMSARTRDEALKYVARQQADGWTAVYDALKLAFEDQRVDTIVLLTDGTPQHGTIDDPAEIRAEVKRWNSTRHIRIHCVSLGGPQSLLQHLAADSGGDFREVR